MIKITANLLNHYFLPLLREVLVDAAEGKKNPYLNKLLIAEELTPLEKTNFMNDYFLTRPSYLQYLGNESETDREFFREQFLAQLANGLENRLVLSGFEGLQNAYLPGKNQSFDLEKQRNIYLLAYNMALGFEKKQIQLLIQQKSASGTITPNQAQKDLQALEKEQFKLLELNGWQYVSSDQLKIIASSPKYNSLQVSPYISCIRTDAQGPEVLTQQKIRNTENLGQPSGVETQIFEEPFADSSAGEFISLGEMKKLLDESKLAQLEMILAERGLNVVGHLHIDDFGMVSGKVSDPQGQIYEIHIDTSKGIDPKSLKATYAVLQEPAKKEDQTEQEKEKFQVDFSKLELNAKPAQKQTQQEEKIALPIKNQIPAAVPTAIALPKPLNVKIPAAILKTPAQTVLPAKPKISVWQQKIAREAKPSLNKKAAPLNKRPPIKPLPRFIPLTTTTQKQTIPASKPSKNPMVSFAKWGTFGGIAGFIGGAGAIVFSKFFKT